MKLMKTIIQQLDQISSPQTFTVSTNQHLTLILLATKSTDYVTEVVLSGDGASADIFGIVLGNESHVIKINTLQDHQAPHTTSNLLIKSVLAGRSQLKYEGFIKVRKDAQLTNAYQRNENLMLSPEAKAESKPALEILANDVRCTHSATIGKVDPEQLFYLQSRGISVKKATQLIVEGFFDVILSKIQDQKLRQSIYNTVGLLVQ